MELSIATKKILEKIREIICQVSDREFSQPAKVLNGSSVGQHVRHILEFFICLHEGYFRGIINYDKRRRNKSIESNRSVALSSIEHILWWIRFYHLSHDLVLELNYADTEEKMIRVKTNYYRELEYNLEHAEHHLEMIYVGLREVSSISFLDLQNINDGTGTQKQMLRSA